MRWHMAEPQPRARVLLFVEALKQAEDALGVSLLEADAVVTYADDALLAVELGGDVYLRGEPPSFDT